MQNQNNDPNFTDSIEQLAAMRMGTAYRQSIKVRAYHVLVRPLTIGEHLAIASEMALELATFPPIQRTAVLENIMLAKKCLVRASTASPDPKDGPFITEMIIDRMTNDELMALYKQWVSITNKVDPNFEDIPDDEILALAERLKTEINTKKNPSAVIESSFSQLANLVLFLLTSHE